MFLLDINAKFKEKKLLLHIQSSNIKIYFFYSYRESFLDPPLINNKFHINTIFNQHI